MMSSQFVLGLLTVLGLVGLCLSVPVPLVEKEFFWFQTEDGRMVPAFLKARSPMPTPAQIEEDCTFWHYLPGQENGTQLLPNCTDNCLSGFASNAPLFLAAHGFGGGSGHLGGLGNNIRAGFKERGEPVNIVLINWAELSKDPDYGAAVRNTEPVGEYIAKLINFLVEQGVATLDETYYAGHSLAGHIPNYIDRNLVGGKMRAVFGLDPAWPLFERREDDERLDPSDAQFVNVFHTSIIYLGFKNPAGHVDFYPNSGKNQPGCDDNMFGSCSHSIVHDFFRESIGNPEAFSSCKCESWEEYDGGNCACEEKAPMGWGTPITTRGVFYLRTNPEKPYSQN